jgi:hypothetical protein
MSMDEQEIEVVAEELAKAGGVAWHPGRTTEPVLRIVNDRYPDRARLAIAALERWRARRFGSAHLTVQPPEPSSRPQDEREGRSGLQVGAGVIYRPPGDKRAMACRVERVEKGRVYLVPRPIPDIGWIDVNTLQPSGENVLPARHESSNK